MEAETKVCMECGNRFETLTEGVTKCEECRQEEVTHDLDQDFRMNQQFAKEQGEMPGDF